MVVVARVTSDRRRRGGFSLIELLVVVIIIGVIAALAIPTMSVLRLDSHAYEDAGAIMQLFRSARTRAIARGGAVLVTMTASGVADRGTFMMYEAVAANPGTAGNTGLNRTPVATCKTPTAWPPLNAGNTGIVFIDGVNLNGLIEVQADIQTQMFIYTSPANATANAIGAGANICWTPLGRSYIALGAPSATMFNGMLPTVSPLELRVHRTGGGTYRSVLIPPNGMARVFSHV
ncbi:MAG: prepilin-type N-terminal cleavage/methylation domain-containing protein [Myxococcota bacterium]|nr:prepilin-type N-terminal cleavage/methylation domain-containing protein [Myxococcota bacterium]